jgi:hypothetical protein
MDPEPAQPDGLLEDDGLVRGAKADLCGRHPNSATLGMAREAATGIGWQPGGVCLTYPGPIDPTGAFRSSLRVGATRSATPAAPFCQVCPTFPSGIAFVSVVFTSLPAVALPPQGRMYGRPSAPGSEIRPESGMTCVIRRNPYE